MRPSQIPPELKARMALAPEGSGERALQSMAWLCETGVREVARNSGPWVDRFLRLLGLGPGYAWCAAALNWSCAAAGAWHAKSGAVRVWAAKAAQAGRVRTEPRRGRACFFLNPNGTGHIGIVAQVYEDGRTRTYEGNTGRGKKGSARDGDGLYERTRPKGFWDGFIDLEGE